MRGTLALSITFRKSPDDVTGTEGLSIPLAEDRAVSSYLLLRVRLTFSYSSPNTPQLIFNDRR